MRTNPQAAKKIANRPQKALEPLVVALTVYNDAAPKLRVPYGGGKPQVQAPFVVTAANKNINEIAGTFALLALELSAPARSLELEPSAALNFAYKLPVPTAAASSPLLQTAG